MKRIFILLVASLASSILPAQQQPTARGNVFLDFENLGDFTLSFTPWSTKDVDGYLTFGIEDYSFPHTGEAMSFICFNPGSSTPSLLDDPAILPHGGYKYAACFASQTHPNDDWIISPLIELGTNGLLKFWVKSYTSNYSLERYKVGVSTSNTDPSSFTIISPGSYLIAPASAWIQKEFDLSAYANQDIYIGINCVSDNAFILMLDDIEITSQSLVTSTLTGQVTDAINGTPIENALVSVAGLSDYTDEDGNYTIANIPAGSLNADFNADLTTGDAPLTVHFSDLSTEGTHTVTASAEGYTNYTDNQVAIPAGGSLQRQISLSPVLADGQYRLVLTWGESPADLDAHLKTPVIEGNAYHIFFNDLGLADGPPYAILDIDDQSGYGPETMTIYGLRPGEYHYFIHNFSQSPELTTSNATVQIYNKNGLQKTLQVPIAGTGLYWDVCTINGSNGSINILNRIVESEPGEQPKLSSDQIIKEPFPSRNIFSWNWNFGDGSTSTEQNPVHAYTANGAYTVSLVVSDGSNTNMETKHAYIQVGPAGVSEAAWEKEVNVFPNPAKDQLFIVSTVKIISASLIDLSGVEKLRKVNSGLNMKLDLSAIPAGIYILSIVTEKGALQSKVNVLR